MIFIKKLLGSFISKKDIGTITYCRRCGRKLITAESKKLGLGKCCYKKEMIKTSFTKKLF